MKNNAKATAFIGLCTALALIFAYVEAILPPLYAGIPGIKMGLPNIIIVFLLYRCGSKVAAIVSLARILLVAWSFGNFILYSLAGGILSLSVMILLKKINGFSTVGVSVAGAVCHNLGQIIVAMLIMNTASLAYYMMVLTITGTIAGVLIGLCGAALIKKIPQKFISIK